MRSNLKKTTVISRLMQLALAGTLAFSLSGCAVYEYFFGGPDPEDMPQIEMKRPEAAAATDKEIVNQPSQRKYPTRWTNGQLLD